MLPGFPKQVTKQKLKRGQYRLTRDDGVTVEVTRGVGGWLVGSSGRKVMTLSQAEHDLRHGYTAHDQLGIAAAERQEAIRLKAWETAMGMLGYAGSPAQAADFKARALVGARTAARTDQEG